MVVGRGGAAGAGEGGEPGAGRRTLHVLVYERPCRVQVDEPLEERGLLREPAGGPLIEVVVAVHEPRRGKAPAPVDAQRPLAEVFFRHVAPADGRNAIALDDEVAGGVLGAAGVYGGHGATLDHRALQTGSSLAAARRTASRIFS